MPSGNSDDIAVAADSSVDNASVLSGQDGTTTEDSQDGQDRSAASALLPDEDASSWVKILVLGTAFVVLVGTVAGGVIVHRRRQKKDQQGDARGQR